MASRSERSGILAFALLLFFASGFSALLYQTIWQRMLGFFSGVDVYSVTITVAAFMAGLGCGSLSGGQLADRLSHRHRLVAFALAELVIALFALGSKWLYYDLLYLKWHALGDSPVVLALVLFASLLVPTFCMGLTLPLLARTFTSRIERASAVVGYLYGINTLGAAAGALVTAWVLLRHFSFPEILQIGAIANAGCAIGAVLVWWRLKDVAGESPPLPGPVEAKAAFSVRIWMFLYALSGFIALSLEIVWFRLLGVLQKSTSFTFPTLLAVYLGGLAAGVIAGVWLARRVRRPALVFLALQSGVTLYAASSLALLLHHVNRRDFLERLWSYLGSYEPINAADVAAAIRTWLSAGQVTPDLSESASFGMVLYFWVPFFLIVPSTFLMGLSFPVLQKLVHDNPLLLGRRVGWLQALNIAGSLLGAAIVGWWTLHWLGSSGTLKLLVILGGCFLGLFAWQSTTRRWTRASALILCAVCVGWVSFLVPASEKMWAKLHGTATEAIIAREGASGVAVVKGEPSGFEKDTVWVFGNGIGQSWLPYGSAHTQIGLLAVALHPQPVEVAVIGLGSGDTVYALAGSPHTRRLTAIEIISGTHDALHALTSRFHYAALDALLRDSRIRWVFADGRAHLLRNGERFDVIEADALRPNSSYSGNLYSWEYFDLLKNRLQPDGLAVTWAPTPRVLASFLKSFPHAIVVRGIAIGGQKPVEVDPAAIQERLAHPFTSEHYGRLNCDLNPMLADLIAGNFQRYSPESKSGVTSDLNSDLFPKDEYMIPQGQ